MIEHHRPLPRAFAAVALHQRRRRGVLPRLGGLDAAQLRPARRGRCAGRESRVARAPAITAPHVPRGQPTGMGARRQTERGRSASRKASFVPRMNGCRGIPGAVCATFRASRGRRLSVRMKRRVPREIRPRRYSISPAGTSFDDNTRPSGATISTGTPATLASNSDFRLAPHISRRMPVLAFAATGVMRIAR